MIDRRFLIHFDWGLLGIVLLISAMGILNLYSATAHEETTGMPLYFKQILWLGFGLGIMLAITFFEYRHYTDFAYLLHGVAVVLLVVVLAFGIITSGAQRWIRLGPLTFQPSEFVKISLILALAKYFQRYPGREGFSLKQIGLPLLLFLVPMGLILKQPDLGTAILLLLVFLSILVYARVRWSVLATLAGTGLFLVPIAWRLLKDYQKQRIITFLNPDLDPLGTGYHLIQSRIAIGSGGFFGKGFMKGTQCKLGFLPEQHTDFIFSAFGEEWGLVGCAVLLGLYLLLILKGLQIAENSKDRFGAILSFGVVAMIFWHTFINIAMVLGLLPVVGIPLPLFSYGGSFLLSTLMGIGLLQNVNIRRYLF
ncbi:MAG: rod shape-determining protein RodA [Desulfobacterota bacterium]|nr:rod shape-determining protein RodA [Thermodesulfobacteriota bacterium]